MEFYFCDKCGARVTDAELQAGATRDHSTAKILCKGCTASFQTVEVPAIAAAPLRTAPSETPETPQVKIQPVPASTRKHMARADSSGPQGANPALLVAIAAAVGLTLIAVLFLRPAQNSTLPSKSPAPAVVRNDAHAPPAPSIPAAAAPKNLPPEPPRATPAGAPSPSLEERAAEAFAKLETRLKLMSGDDTQQQLAIREFLNSYGESIASGRARILLEQLSKPAPSDVKVAPVAAAAPEHKPSAPSTAVRPSEAPKPAETAPAKKPEPAPADPVNAAVINTAMAPRPAWTPKRTGERREAPAQCAKIATALLTRALPELEHAEQSKEYEHAWTWNSRLERYQPALNDLLMFSQDKKKYAQAERNPVGPRQKLWETGMMLMVSPITHEWVDKAFLEWKEAVLAKFGKTEQELTGWQSTGPKLKLYKEFSTSSLPDYIKKQEAAGDSDPAALWDLCVHFEDERPYAPLRYAQVLYKLREWYPDFKESGEVQYRLAKDLCNGLDLPKEAVAELEVLFEKFKTNAAIAKGDATWLYAEALEHEAAESHQIKEQNEIWTDARHKYQEFQKQFPKHGNNKEPGPGQQSQCAGRIEWLSKKLGLAKDAP